MPLTSRPRSGRISRQGGCFGSQWHFKETTVGKLNPNDRRSPEDLTGKKFNRWTVLNYSHSNEHRMAYWNCRCECGTERSVTSQSLKNGTSKSCGCYNLEVRSSIDGLTAKHRPEYEVYRLMVRRCTDPNEKSYHRYGGRGIKVCDRWLESFKNFLDDMGLKPDKNCQLDRENNNGDYCKDNCRWASKLVQANNTRTNRLIEYKGETRTLAEWARIKGLNDETLRNRLDNYGWTIEEAMETPARPKQRMITYQGRTQMISAWAKEIGISPSALKNRLNCGMSFEEAYSAERVEYGSLSKLSNC